MADQRKESAAAKSAMRSAMAAGSTLTGIRWSSLCVEPVLRFGLYRCKHHADFGDLAFTDFDLYIGIEGFATVEMLGRTVDLSPGRTLLIPPRTMARFRTDHRQPSYMGYYHFKCRVAGREIRNSASLVDPRNFLLRLPGLPPVSLLCAHVDGNLAADLAKAYQEMVDDLAQFRAVILLLETMRLLREAHAAPPQLNPQRISAMEAALEHMQENLHRPLRLPELARIAGVSVSTLGRLFEARMRTTPMRYMAHLRLARARELLTTTRMPVKQVAFACGFKSLSIFSHLFATAHGQPPSVYRRESYGVS